MRKIFLVMCLLAGIISARAQSGTVAAGGEASGSNGSVSYSVGQVVLGTATGNNGSINIGLQQPFDISTVTGIHEAKGITLECKVYPNPTTDFVYLAIKDYEIKGLSYQLIGTTGAMLAIHEINTDNTEISMQHYTPGIYLLRVIGENQVIKVFKIVKK